jgi:predicted transcriptional regulator of viral defense system
MAGDATPISHAMDGKWGSRGVDAAIAELADQQHGVVGRRQLLDLGIGRGAIEGRLARGQLHRLHVGAYSVGHRLVSREGRWLAAVLAAGSGAALSHRSAAQLWRLIPRSSITTEVTRRRGWRSPVGIRVRASRLRSDEVAFHRGILVTSVSRTLFDFAGTASKRELERAMHEAEVRQLTDRLSLPDLLDRYPRRQGTANLRELLETKAPAGVTQNDLEELFVQFLDARGLPRPLLNGTLPVRGRLFRPDCMWLEQRLLAELDGRAVHGTEQAFERDRQRDRILLVEGWRSTRITWRQLRDEPAAIAGDLRRLLRT